MNEETNLKTNLKAKISNLQEKIRDLVEDFNEDTGFQVTDISTIYVDTGKFCGSHPTLVKVEIKIQ